MKILISWLADFVDLGAAADPTRLTSILADAGIPVAAREGEGDETVLELEVTANRPDLLSHYGVARELAACLGLPLREIMTGRALPSGESEESGGSEGSRGSFPISIESDRCDRYLGLVLRGVKIGPSPEWLATRLTRIGLRPISNVVDITNYVLMELNHPLHAFDLQKLRDRVVVRAASLGEEIALLDGSRKLLTSDDLVIADAARPIALAGVMGGSATSVESGTTDLLLEAAWFDPSSVRRTARRHGVSSDSSYRFERGADFDAVPVAMRRMAGLILETAGGRIDGGVIDVRRAEHPPRRVRFRSSAVKRHLGYEVPETNRILASIGVKVDGETVTPPSWRSDIEREIDCVEEIARLAGFDRIPATLPALRGRTPDFHAGLAGAAGLDASSEAVAVDARGAMDRHTAGDAAAYRRFRRLASKSLERQGLDRCVTFTFETPAFGDVKIANPLNMELSTMRGTLLPGLCRVARIRADRAGTRTTLLYELDKVFGIRDGRPLERDAVAVLVGGEAEAKRYDGRDADRIVFDHALGLLRELAADLSLPIALIDHPPDADEIFPHHATLMPLSASIQLGGVPCGRIGGIERAAVPGGESDAAETAFGFEIDLTALWVGAGRRRGTPRYRPLPRFPGSSRDLAFLVDPLVTVGAVLDAARAANPDHLESLDVFDVFPIRREKKPPAAGTSIGVRCLFRSSERTLTDAEVNAAVARIVESVTRLCGATLRAQ